VLTRAQAINAGKPFQITATEPGVYRFAVASHGDINFNGALDGGEALAATISPTP